MLITINHHVTSAKDKLEYLKMLDREGLCWANGKPLLQTTKHEPVWINIYLEYNQGIATRKVKYVSHDPEKTITMQVQDHDEVRDIVKRFHQEINRSYDASVVDANLFKWNRELMAKYH